MDHHGQVRESRQPRLEIASRIAARSSVLGERRVQPRGRSSRASSAACALALRRRASPRGPPSTATSFSSGCAAGRRGAHRRRRAVAREQQARAGPAEDVVRLRRRPERRVREQLREEIRHRVAQRAADVCRDSCSGSTYSPRAPTGSRAEASRAFPRATVRLLGLADDLLARPRLQVDGAGDSTLLALRDLPGVRLRRTGRGTARRRGRASSARAVPAARARSLRIRTAVSYPCSPVSSCTLRISAFVQSASSLRFSAARRIASTFFSASANFWSLTSASTSAQVADGLGSVLHGNDGERREGGQQDGGADQGRAGRHFQHSVKTGHRLSSGVPGRGGRRLSSGTRTTP